jgi:anti-sigma regulatory factor (Ser/Thr protein kinase)
MNEQTLETAATRENLGELFSFVDQALTRLHTPEANRGKMMMALDEILTNVVLYAYPEDQRGTVCVCIRRDGPGITAEIVDHGQPFDPTAHPTPDVSLPLEQRPIGGLGIHLTRTLVTRMRYARENEANRLTLTSTWEETHA